MESFTSNGGAGRNFYKADRLFFEMFEDTVARCGDKTAVIWKNESISYQKLDKKSTLVAQCIAGRGLGCEDVIGIKLGRTINAIVAMVGILKADAAFLFLDSVYPKEKLQYMVGDCKCALIITEEFMEDLENMSHAVPEAVRPKDLAVIIYTSGSTGNPKGVMIEQKNLAALINSYNDLEITEDDVLGAFANFCFVACLNDVFTPLAIGATVDIVLSEIRKHIKLLAQYYQEHKITITYLPPHMAEKYMSLDADNTTLKTLIVSSEPARNLQKRQYNIRNVYAASELCNFVSSYLITEKAGSYPIGKIKKTLKYYILDDNHNAVPDGEIGELCLSGPQISRGYLNNPEKTAAQYIENPFTREEPYQTLYKTGDLVQELPDGNLKFVCRKDWMLKIRGYRVESREVELAMQSYHEITGAAVTAYPDDGGTNILCGYFTAEQEIEIEKFKAFLKSRLPNYMVPLKLIRIDNFPRNLNGKIDKHLLPVPEGLHSLPCHNARPKLPVLQGADPN